MAEPQLDPNSASQTEVAVEKGAEIPPSPDAEDVAALVFQSNPDQWDMRRFLQPGAEAPWRVTAYRDEMRPGRLVLLWEAKGKQRLEVRGLYGWGIITSGVAEGAGGRETIRLQYVERWLHPDDAARKVPDRRHVAAIPASEVFDLPSWPEHRLKTLPIGTNFVVTKQQLEELSERIVKRRLTSSQFPGAVNQVMSGQAVWPASFEPIRVVAIGGLVDVRAVDDTPAESDALGFWPLVEGLDGLLNSEATKFPLAIALTAPWGRGKSSVMRQLERSLRESDRTGPGSWGYRRRWWTVDFDAWRYEKSERLWAALAKAMYEQPQKQMGWLRALWFRIRLGRKRLGWSFLALAAAIAAGLVVLALGIAPDIDGDVSKALTGSGGAASGTGAALMVWFLGVLSHPFKRSIQSYVARPKYQEQLGFTAEAERDIDYLMETLTPSEHDGLAVFVDDLDRCSSRHVVEVVEAINQIFNSVRGRGCAFLLGMDREVVAAGIDAEYKEMIALLKARRSPIGEDYGLSFLAKIVQMSVTIPRPDPDSMMRLLHVVRDWEFTQPRHTLPPAPDAVNEFVGQLNERSISNPVEARRVQDEMEASLPPEADDRTRRALSEAVRVVIADTFRADSPDVRHAEEEVVRQEFLRPNPRQLKRFDNAFRLQLYVAAAASDWSLDLSRDELLALAKWVAMRLRWPRLAQDLDADPGLLKALEDSANDPTALIDKGLAQRYERWFFKEPALQKILRHKPQKRIASFPWQSFLRVT